MADLVWTTEEVRALALQMTSEMYRGDPVYVEAAARAFDGWLAAHEVEVKAAAEVKALRDEAERFRAVPDEVGGRRLPSWEVAGIIDRRASALERDHARARRAAAKQIEGQGS